MNDVLPLHQHQPNRRPGIPSEAEARAADAERLRLAREISGLTLDQWVEEWNTALGRPTVTPGKVLIWEDPTRPKPPSHWMRIAMAIAAAIRPDLASRLLL